MKAFVTKCILCLALVCCMAQVRAGQKEDSLRVAALRKKAIILGDTGLQFQIRKDFKSALLYYDKSLNIGNAIKDTTLIAGTLTNSGMIYKDQGDYNTALENFLQASEYYQELYKTYGKVNDLEDYAACLSSLGDLYKQIGQPDLALEKYRDALNIRLRLNNRSDIASSYNFIGLFYTDSTRYNADSALHYLYLALGIKQTLPHPERLASTMLNIALVHKQEGNIKYSTRSFSKIVYNDSFNTDRQALSEARYELALIRIAEKKYDEVIYLCSKNLVYARENSLRPLMIRNADLLRKSYKAKGDPAKALEYADLSDLLKNDIESKSTIRLLNERIFKEQKEKAEQKFEILYNEKTIAELWQRALIVIVVLILSLLFIAMASRSKEKRSKEKIELLMRELNHRVKNNFQILKSLLSIEQGKITSPETKSAVKDITNRVEAMTKIHSRLYSDSNITSIPFDDYIRDLLKDLAYSYNFSNGELQQTLELEKINIDIEKAIPLGLMVNEIVSNAFKHAYRFVEKPEITIRLKAESLSIVSLYIADNGKEPLPVNTKEHDSFGIKLIQMLCRQLKAQIEIMDGNGTAYLVKVEK